MPRKKLIYSSDFPYHITNRSNNREFFLIPMEPLWFIFLEKLTELKLQFSCEIHSFVLMSNHYHLILSTPRGNIGEAMKYFQREVARAANKHSDRINHFFGGRYKWTLIGHENYYWNSVKYVFRNPVRAKICTQVSDYPFSSLNRTATDFEWDMVDVFAGREKKVELDLNWLDEPFAKEKEEAIKKGLRRREFKLPTDKSGKAFTLDPMRRKKGTVT